MAVFRGSATGCSLEISENPRLVVAEMDKIENSDSLDAAVLQLPKGYISHNQSWNTESPVVKNRQDFKDNLINKISCEEWDKDPTRQYMSLYDQSKYKYILNIEGNSAAYRFSYLLKLKSVIINIDCENKLWWETLQNKSGETICKEFRFVDGRPEKEYDSVEKYIFISLSKSNLKNDLESVIQWCLENDDICKEIANNAKEFYDTYINENMIYNYLESVINNIAIKFDTSLTNQVINNDEVLYQDDDINNYDIEVVEQEDELHQFTINGEVKTSITLIPNQIYIFNQSDSSNLEHTIKFSKNPLEGSIDEYGRNISERNHELTIDTALEFDVEVIGISGNNGAETKLIVKTPNTVLYIYCEKEVNMGFTAIIDELPEYTTQTDISIADIYQVPEYTPVPFHDINITNLEELCNKYIVKFQIKDKLIEFNGNIQLIHRVLYEYNLNNDLTMLPKA